MNTWQKRSFARIPVVAYMSTSNTTQVAFDQSDDVAPGRGRGRQTTEAVHRHERPPLVTGCNSVVWPACMQNMRRYSQCMGLELRTPPLIRLFFLWGQLSLYLQQWSDGRVNEAPGRVRTACSCSAAAACGDSTGPQDAHQLWLLDCVQLLGQQFHSSTRCELSFERHTFNQVALL